MPRHRAPDRRFEFVLVLTGLSEIGADVLDALFESGCDDATPSLRLSRVYLTFDREADSLREAILSAIRDVHRSGTGARVRRVDQCDLLSQADIARRIGRSRQQVGQYVTGVRGPGHFPAPVCDRAGGHSLWSWREVASWLGRNGIVDDAVVHDSRDVATINSALELIHYQKLDPDLVSAVWRVFQDAEPPASAAVGS